MAYLLLSINAGSSSLKTTLFQVPEDKKQLKCLANAEISAINQPPSKLKYVRGSDKQEKELDDVNDHKQAFEHVLDAFLADDSIPEIKDKSDIRYACHRVVHGGDFEEDQLITKETFHKIEQLQDLAPLHNASAVSLMKACHEHIPKVTNVACFDSGFHATIPAAAKTYMINQDIAQKKGLRKYGFHGLSYAYITRAVADHLHQPPEQTSIIALHLGSGASACAIQNGKSVDTTMGLTPVSGLPGGTRSGDIDPSLIFHYTSDVSKLSPASTKDLHITSAEEILNKQCGWKALTGTSDFAEIARPDAPDTHRLALDIFVDRILGYVGSYFVKLGGKVDALVFAGGVGEKSDLLRRMVVQRCECLGFRIDEQKNREPGSGVVVDISADGGAEHKVLICETDEDYQMAFSTMKHPK